MWSSLAAVLGVLGVVVAAAEARTIGDGGVNYLQSLVDTLGDEGTKRFNTFTVLIIWKLWRPFLEAGSI